MIQGDGEKIKTIVRDVLKKGLEEPYKNGGGSVKSLNIKGETVDVTYKIIAGTVRVGSAWIR